MDEEIYLNLVYKELDGTLTAAEQQQLEDWLAASEYNLGTAQGMREAWEASAELGVEPPEVDLDAEYGSLQGRIAEEKEKTRSNRNMTRFLLGLVGLAAAASIFVVLGMIFLPSMQSVAWKEFATTDKIDSITLQDGTKVTLNRNSTLHYPPDNADYDMRQVRLEGEAFFEVAHNPLKFVAYTKNEEITVLGTSFSVRCYPDEQETRVQVETGTVQVKRLGSDRVMMLGAGSRGVSNADEKRMEYDTEGSENEYAWLKRKLVFRDTKLRDVIRQMQNAYHIDVNVSVGALLECPFTSTFDQVPAKEALQTIATVFGAELKQEGKDTYLLSGGACDTDLPY